MYSKAVTTFHYLWTWTPDVWLIAKGQTTTTLAVGAKNSQTRYRDFLKGYQLLPVFNMIKQFDLKIYYSTSKKM